jgi:beta-galactosidase
MADEGMQPPGAAARSGKAAWLWGRLGRIAYGADYNPEQWDEATWAEDVKLMAGAGVNLVSLAIFGWAALQPNRDRFEWSWLDRVMDMLRDAGISVCLATATASPPPWLVTAHPEILPEDADGHRLWHGSRQHFCPSSRVFREQAGELVEAMAARYGSHPALAAWHVGNEYGCHVSRCYCDESAEAFRAWLRGRYGSLDELNAAWSTSFWSQRYSAWEQIIPPRRAPTFPNPSQQLDFSRFSSDALLGCFRHEADILRRVTPDVPVTTNFLGIFKPVDGFAWAVEEDFVSHDSYPDPADPDAAVGAAMAFDFMRGASGGKPWLLLEQAPSAVNWRDVNQPKTAAQYRLWSWQAVAHGANGVMSFQWRASRGGAEKFHSAMVPHGGADHPVYRHVAELGRELAEHPELSATESGRAEVALLFDWPSWWALELPSRPSSRLSLLDLARAYYEPLWRAGVPVDLVRPDSDLSGYRLAVAPNLYLLSTGTAGQLARWVHGGGHLVTGFFSGIADDNDRVCPGPYPGALRELLGVTIDQFWPLGPGDEVGLRLAGQQEAAQQARSGRCWSEEIRLDDATAAGWFDGGPLDGRPALTTAERGRGRASYCGTLPDAATLAGWLAKAAEGAGLTPLLERTAHGIEVQRRLGQGFEALFVLNHDITGRAVRLAGRWEPAVGPAPRGLDLDLGPRELAVLRRGTGNAASPGRNA